MATPLIGLSTTFKEVDKQLALTQANINNAPELYTGIGAALRTLVDLGFKSSRDPYGNPWRPLKKRKGQPLIDTGRGRSSFTYSATGSEVELGSSVGYMALHQTGFEIRRKTLRVQPVNKRGRFIKKSQASTRKRGSIGVRFLQPGSFGQVPARKMLPETEPLPPAWQKAVTGEFRAFVRRLGGTST